MEEKLEALVVRYDELQNLLADPECIADQDRWQKLAREHSDISVTVDLYNKYKSMKAAVDEARELLESDDEEMRELARAELEENGEELESLEQEIKQRLIPADPMDDKNVVLEIRAGTGGEEAALFGMDLLKMYTRFCESKGWSFELVSVSQTDIGGIKEAECMVSGAKVYRSLKYEIGVHRVQRIPATGGRIHTSAATVAVLPEADDVDVTINQNDLLIETHRSSGAGGQHVNKTESAIRMVHIPTGIVVNCQDERSQIKNREKAMRVMKARVADYYRSAAEKEYSDSRKNQVGSGDRSERIRTYNFPQGRVTDHRIGLTLYKLDEFMGGDMDQMINALVLAGSTGDLEERE